MRAALILLLVVGCAKKGAERQSAEPANTVGGAAPPASAPTTTAVEPPKGVQQAETGVAPPPPAEGAPRGGGAPGGGGSAGGSAIDQARAAGVLGPTDQQAFAIKSSVAIKTASTKQVDAAAKTNLDAVKACYDKALEFQDTLSGELTLAVKDGKATVAKSTLKHAELEKCVVEALTGLHALKRGKATLVLAFKRE